MSESVHKVTRRIEELQGAARKARLEAMQLAAKLLTTSNSELAGSPTNAHRVGELAALRARYEGLVKIADEAQAQIYRLQAEEHQRKPIADPPPSLHKAAEAAYPTAALQRCGVLDDGRVVSVEAEAPRNQLVSCIVRLRLGYEGAAEAAPRSLILKMPLPGDRNDRPFVQGASEVAFYAKVRRDACGQVPRCFDGDWQDETREWHLLLEDLTDTHEIATPWPLPPDEATCRRMVQTLARFHAAWWDDPRLGVGSVRGSMPRRRARRCSAMPPHSSASPTIWAIACRARGVGSTSASSRPRPPCRRAS